MLEKFNSLPEKTRHISVICLFAILITLPFMVMNFKNTYDTVLAFLAFRSFSEQFFGGELYPRWMFDFYNFHGAPLFYYYPPLVFYFETFIDFITFRIIPDFTLLSLIAVLMIMISGLACYVWLKDLFGAKKAFIPSLIYMILPNHLSIDLYLKGTLTELSSYIWMPLILLFIKKSFETQNGWIILAVLYAALILSTVPLALVLSPLFIFYIGFLIFLKTKEEKKWEASFLLPYASLVMGFCLAGFYIVTAYLMTDYIRVEEFWSANYNPRNWFFCLTECQTGTNGFLQRKFTDLFSAQILIILALFIYLGKYHKEKFEHYIFWSVMALGAYFMMSEYSIFFWDHIPLLERIQFPFRIAVTLDIILVFALAQTQIFKTIKMQKAEIFTLICIMLFFTFSLRTYYGFANRFPMYTKESFEGDIKYRGYFEGYIPSFSDVSLSELLKLAKNSNMVEIIDDNGEATKISHDQIPYGMAFNVDHSSPAQVNIRQLYFPSWKAYNEKTGEEYPLSIDNNTGTIVLDYSGGNNKIVLKHVMIWQEKVGLTFSSFAALLLIGFGFFNKRHLNNSRRLYD